jgi:hypothetical protein
MANENSFDPNSLGFTQDQLKNLSPAQQSQLADLAMFGQAVSTPPGFGGNGGAGGNNQVSMPQDRSQSGNALQALIQSLAQPKNFDPSTPSPPKGFVPGSSLQQGLSDYMSGISSGMQADANTAATGGKAGGGSGMQALPDLSAMYPGGNTNSPEAWKQVAASAGLSARDIPAFQGQGLTPEMVAQKFGVSGPSTTMLYPTGPSALQSPSAFGAPAAPSPPVPSAPAATAMKDPIGLKK